MDAFIKSIRKSVENSNWYSALFGALCIPDICGKVQYPEKHSKPRYIEWFDSYLKEKYSACDEEYLKFLTGSDCYALRCSFLHERSDQILGQSAREILNEVCFFKPDSVGFGPVKPGHCNRLSNVTINDRNFDEALCLRVDTFCHDVCDAAERWLNDVAQNSEIQTRLSQLLYIY